MIAVAERKPRIQLRPYQERGRAWVHEQVNNGTKKPLVIGPTGSGKTIVFVQLVKDFLAEGKRVLVLVHLKTLVGQTSATFDKFGIPHGFIKAGYDEDRKAPCQLASIQTLPRRRWWKELDFDVIIYDEAHTTMWSTPAKMLMEAIYPDAVHLGLTATPWLLSPRKGMADIIEASLTLALPSELMAEGFLTPGKYYGIPGTDLSGAKIEKGDYSVTDLWKLVGTAPGLLQQAYDEWARLVPGKRTIVFCINVEHVNQVAGYFESQGVKTGLVTGETPDKERQSLYDDLADGVITVLVSCNVLSVGFDVPAAEVALLLRPTMSASLHYQQIGRVLRPSPETGKEWGYVLDQAGNIPKHGVPEQLEKIDFGLERGRKPGNGECMLKECPECKQYVQIMLRHCNAVTIEDVVCGYEFPVKERLEFRGQLQELNVNARKKKKSKTPAHSQEAIDLWRDIANDNMRLISKGSTGATSRELVDEFCSRFPDCSFADLKYVGGEVGYNRGWANHRHSQMAKARLLLPWGKNSTHPLMPVLLSDRTLFEECPEGLLKIRVPRDYVFEVGKVKEKLVARLQKVNPEIQDIEVVLRHEYGQRTFG
jgi:superfamily II DNA or RNA helicase